MIVSVNWLKKYTDIDLPVDELATLIGARLVEIEEVIDLGAKYENVIVAKVVECEKLEGSDHLNVTKLDDGGKTPEVERDENGLVQVVCGAPNVRKGITVAWLPPGSTVPQTHGDDEPFVLGARKLRGVMSNGMIASARELDLFDEHDGILELDDDLEAGASFAKSYELDDYLLDIENKSLTHRPDCFGIIGIAREVAAIQGKKFTTPDWLAKVVPEFGEKLGDVATPSVTIEDPELCARYQAVVLSGADGAAKSPLQVQTYLARVGVRPISAVVDATNYLMMLTGQPLHAFDYDKLVKVAGGTADIRVRGGKQGEKLALLDGREIKLSENDIVIAAGDTAIGLAGAMGGASTEISENTTKIIIESATFNLYNLRATQMRHGIFSEAITRFTKGQPAGLGAPVLADAVRLTCEWAGAQRVSDVAESYPGKQEPQPIRVSLQKNVNGLLGTNYTAEQVVGTLTNVEFTAVASGDELTVTPPYWRNDIHIPEDITEEIGRLNGYDTIAPVLPKRDFTAVRPSQFDEVRAAMRQALVRAGANEVFTYSFVHGDILQKAGQKPEDSYRLTNSLSPDLQYYRQSLTPSLLGAVHPNIKIGFDSFALFELNKVHLKPHGLTDEGVPAEVDMLALVVAHKKPQLGAAFYQAKQLLRYLGDSLGLDLIFSPLDADPNYPVTAPFEHRRAALVTDARTDTFLGVVGEYKKSVAKGFKLPGYCAGFEISTKPLLEAVQKLANSYTPVSRYPSAERDICFQVASSVQYGQLAGVISQTLASLPLEASFAPLDLYQPEDGLTKNITFRIKLTPHDHTLTSDEAAVAVEKIAAAVVADTGAKII